MTLGMSDNIYLESLLYDIDSIALTAILSIESRTSKCHYLRKNKKGILPPGTWLWILDFNPETLQKLLSYHSTVLLLLLLPALPPLQSVKATPTSEESSDWVLAKICSSWWFHTSQDKCNLYSGCESIVRGKQRQPTMPRLEEMVRKGGGRPAVGVRLGSKSSRQQRSQENEVKSTKVQSK